MSCNNMFNYTIYILGHWYITLTVLIKVTVLLGLTVVVILPVHTTHVFIFYKQINLPVTWGQSTVLYSSHNKTLMLRHISM